MASEQLFFPGMEPVGQLPKPKPPAPTLHAIVHDLERRMFAIEVEITVEKSLRKER